MMFGIRPGQIWRKKQTVHAKPFYARIIGKAHRDGIKTHCSDGDTHNFNPRVFVKYFELVEG